MDPNGDLVNMLGFGTMPTCKCARMSAVTRVSVQGQDRVRAGTLATEHGTTVASESEAFAAIDRGRIRTADRAFHLRFLAHGLPQHPFARDADDRYTGRPAHLWLCLASQAGSVTSCG